MARPSHNNAWSKHRTFGSTCKSVSPNSLAAQVFAAKGFAPRLAQVIPGPVDCCCLLGHCSARRILRHHRRRRRPGWRSRTYERANLINPNNTSSNQYNGRVDYTLGNNQFFGGLLLHAHATNLQGGDRPVDDLTFVPSNWLGTIGWTRTFGATLLNDLRANVTRWDYNQVASSSNTNFGIPFLQRVRLRRGWSSGAALTRERRREGTRREFSRRTLTTFATR